MLVTRGAEPMLYELISVPSRNRKAVVPSRTSAMWYQTPVASVPNEPAFSRSQLVPLLDR